MMKCSIILWIHRGLQPRLVRESQTKPVKKKILRNKMLILITNSKDKTVTNSWSPTCTSEIASRRSSRMSPTGWPSSKMNSFKIYMKGKTCWCSSRSTQLIASKRHFKNSKMLVSPRTTNSLVKLMKSRLRISSSLQHSS